MVTFYSYIVNFIFSLNLTLPKPQLHHILTFMHGIILTDGRKTISQILRSTHDQRDLSCMTKFLNEYPWKTNKVTQKRCEFIMNQIKKARSKKDGKQNITFLILDDTQSKRNRSTTHMEGLNYHFQKPYCHEHGIAFKSKNDLAIELLDTYQPADDEQVYVLVDSWYTSRKLIERCCQKGFHLISGLKANRKIYPAGIGVKITEFASTFIDNNDLRSVTACGHKYRIFEYEGHLSDTENARVLLSWESKFDSSKTPFCILCTECNLDLVPILSFYNARWNIET